MGSRGYGVGGSGGGGGIGAFFPGASTFGTGSLFEALELPAFEAAIVAVDGHTKNADKSGFDEEFVEVAIIDDDKGIVAGEGAAAAGVFPSGDDGEGPLGHMFLDEGGGILAES